MNNIDILWLKIAKNNSRNSLTDCDIGVSVTFDWQYQDLSFHGILSQKHTSIEFKVPFYVSFFLVHPVDNNLNIQ